MTSFRTILGNASTCIARIWNRTAPNMEQARDYTSSNQSAPAHERLGAAPLSRGADGGPDRATCAPKTADIPPMSERLSPSRAAPRPPSRHRPGTPLVQSQRSCADTGPDVELFQQGGDFSQNDSENKSGSKSAAEIYCEREQRVFDYICAGLATTGVSPSFAEIMAGTGASSKSSIHRHVKSLVKRGKLVLLPRRNRAIIIPPGARP